MSGRRPRLWWWEPVTGRAKAWPWSRRRSTLKRQGERVSWREIDGEIMIASRDKFGRPIVVVTGMGVVDIARGRQDRQLGEAHGGRIRHPDTSPGFRSTV